MSVEKLRSWLDDSFTDPVRDPVWKHIYISPGMRRIISSAPFLRLTRIRQLGPAYLVYPGATHSRAAHSLGVFHVARMILRALLPRPGMPELSQEGAAAFLLAALLHDLGHFPYTHSLKELPLMDHEALTAIILREEPLAGMIRAQGADPERVAAIVDHGLPADPETTFYRRLLSGVLDPDKLDYLNRDAYYCGVPYGVQDMDFILSRIEPDFSRGLVLDSRGLMVVEGILFSKYLMYRSVYWHRDVRAATAMVKRSLHDSLLSGCVKPEDLYRLDDDSFRALLPRLDARSRHLAQSVFDGSILPLAFELPFDAEHPVHASLEDLDGRRALEEGAGGGCFLLDLPERVSFESDLWVRDEGRLFTESSTVFSRDVVGGFTGRLRIIRAYALGGGDARTLRQVLGAS